MKHLLLSALLLAGGAAHGQVIPSFDPIKAYSSNGFISRYVATGDLNNDGVLDVVCSNVNSDNVSVLLGRAAGDFMPAVTYSGIKTPEELVLTDANHDGKLDVVVAAEGNVAVLLGTGTGSLGTVSLYSTKDCGQLRTATFADAPS